MVQVRARVLALVQEVGVQALELVEVKVLVLALALAQVVLVQGRALVRVLGTVRELVRVQVRVALVRNPPASVRTLPVPISWTVTGSSTQDTWKKYSPCKKRPPRKLVGDPGRGGWVRNPTQSS